MTYEAIDKWNSEDSLEHRSHKYYMKVGEGPNARYFYSALEYAAYKAGLTKGHKPTGEQQMAEIRNKRAKALYKMESNKERIRKENISRINDRMKRGQAFRRNQAKLAKTAETAEEAARMNRESIKRKQDQTRRKREAREQRFQEIAEERKTDSARRERAYQASQRKIADAERNAKKAKHDAKVRKKSGRNDYYVTRDIDLGNGRKVRVGVGPSKHDVKRAVNKAKYKAKDAYNSAKKTAKKVNNSSTVKTAKKKAKKTVKSAYKRGRRFVNNLFK